MNRIKFYKPPKAKQQRIIFIVILLSVVGFASFMILRALNQNIVFFLTPTLFHESETKPGQAIRLGGQVLAGSLHRSGQVSDFTLSDGTHQVAIRYHGLLPDLFREGQGIIAQGVYQGVMPFQADSILAKHDENYIPRELVDTLKANGQWQE